MREAVEELKRLITERFPQATFVVEEGFDPEGIYLVTTVDIADTDEVIAVVGDRLVELQVDEGLPVYVTPLRPVERVITKLRKREASTPPASLPWLIWRSLLRDKEDTVTCDWDGLKYKMGIQPQDSDLVEVMMGMSRAIIGVLPFPNLKARFNHRKIKRGRTVLQYTPSKHVVQVKTLPLDPFRIAVLLP
jgi:hypothetical protein